MQTVTIDILDKNALRLLEDLELLNLIRVHSGERESSTNRIKPSDYRGSISKETADKLQDHIAQSRNEWDNNF